MRTSESIKSRKSYILVLSLMILSAITTIPIGNVSADIEVINMTISGDKQYLFETFNIKGELIVDENATIAFYGCTFNFINGTTVPRITLRKNSSVIFEHCIFYGPSDDSLGAGFIRGINVRSLKFSGCSFTGMGAQENQGMIVSVIGHDYLDAPFEFVRNRINTDWGVLNITNCVNTTVADNIINGPTVKKFYYGWAVFVIGCKNVTISNNTITGLYSEAFRFSSVMNYLHIENNTLRTIGSYGIYEEFIPAYQHIKNNVIENASNGMYLYRTNTTLILNNTINFDYSGILFNNPPDYTNINTSILFNRLSPDSDSINGYICLGSMKNLTVDYNNFTLPSHESLWQPIKIISSYDYYYTPFVYSEINSTDNNFVGNGRFYIVSHQELGGGYLDASLLYNDAVGFWFVDIDNATILLPSDLPTSVSLSNCNNTVLSGFVARGKGFGMTVSCSSDIILENVNLYDPIVTSGELIRIEGSFNIKLRNFYIEYSKIISTTFVYIYKTVNFGLYNSTFIGSTYSHLYLLETNNSEIVGNKIETTDGPAVNLMNTFNVSLHNNDFIISDPDTRNGEISFNEKAYNGTINITGNHWSGNLNATDYDKDGIADEPYTITSNNMNITDPFPIFVDPDGDGLDTNQENRFGTDPAKKDTDGDDVSDFDEIRLYYTDPVKADTDGDGLNDSEELYPGKDGYVTDPFKIDTDGDRISDYLELIAGTDPTDPNSFPGGLLDSNSTEPIGGTEPNPVNTNIIPGYGMLLPILGIVVFAVVSRVYIHSVKNNGTKPDGKRRG